MKILRHIIFILIAVAGLTFSASAQRNSNQNRPPKDPPVIKPNENKVKPKETPTPRGREKPQKPGMTTVIRGRELNTEEIR